MGRGTQGGLRAVEDAGAMSRQARGFEGSRLVLPTNMTKQAVRRADNVRRFDGHRAVEG